MPTERKLQDFAGRWTVARRIEHADGTTATFAGEVAFVPNAEGALVYTEEGELHLPTGHAMRATRRYLWTEGLVIFFDDGKPFHTIPAQGGETVHVCPPDTYRVAYDFSAWPKWRATWEVSGPKKAYTMTSDYSPL